MSLELVIFGDCCVAVIRRARAAWTGKESNDNSKLKEPPNPALEPDQNARFACVLAAQLCRCTKPLRGSSFLKILPIG